MLLSAATKGSPRLGERYQRLVEFVDVALRRDPSPEAGRRAAHNVARASPGIAAQDGIGEGRRSGGLGCRQEPGVVPYYSL